MVSTATSRLRLNKQGTGDNVNTWGTTLNGQVFDLADEAIAGVETIALTGNKTLTSTNYVSDEARNMALRFTGSLTSGATITIPAVEKLYFIINDTGQTLTFSAGAGTGAIETGRRKWLACDGTDVYIGEDGADLEYVDATFLKRTGGTMTGKITLDGAPTSDLHASTKKYVDDSLMGITASSELPGQAANAGKYLTTNGTVASWYDLDAELATTFQPLDSDLTAVAGLGTQSYGRNSLIWNEATTSGSVSPAVIWTEYLVDTGTAARSITLPAGTDGARIRIKDKDGNAAANLITVTPNGSETIMGETSLEIDINWFAGEFRYRASNTRWELV